MESAEIKNYENGALAFARDIYGKNLADAMYLGTFGEIHYFGPVFYDSKKKDKDIFITFSNDQYSILPTDRFRLDTEDRHDFERRQHIWWDYIATLQCAYERGRREAAMRLKQAEIEYGILKEACGC
ncbi:MAG: hypothetical protein IJL04_01995 [Bacteroidales bacterium]|nr:hypothetical protein [Bacteroidales bacterium]